jgi:hypothetical protein
VPWGDLFCIEKARKRADRNVNSAANHNVLKLMGLDQVADLTLGDPNARSKLLWRFQPIV